MAINTIVNLNIRKWPASDYTLRLSEGDNQPQLNVLIYDGDESIMYESGVYKDPKLVMKVGDERYVSRGLVIRHQGGILCAWFTSINRANNMKAGTGYGYVVFERYDGTLKFSTQRFKVEVLERGDK